MRRPASLVPAVLAATTCAVLVAGLGAATGAGGASSSGGTGGTGGTGHRTFPGASGSVAAITGSSMEVQNTQTGQTTVSWTTSTAFTQMVTVPSSSVAVGDCVTASGTTSKKSKVVTAKTVTVSQPATGTCTGGLAGPGSGSKQVRTGGPFPAGGGTFAGRRPSGSPPAGAARRFAGGASGDFGFASGKVTAVGSGTLVLSGFSSTAVTGRPAKATKTKGKATKTKGKATLPSPKATTVKVAVGSSTTYTERQSAASSNLAVGDCVTATGSADSTGAVAATAVQITSTGGQSCTSGFGSPGGGAPVGA
jgi:hypothetical protein